MADEPQLAFELAMASLDALTGLRGWVFEDRCDYVTAGQDASGRCSPVEISALVASFTRIGPRPIDGPEAVVIPLRAVADLMADDRATRSRASGAVSGLVPADAAAALVDGRWRCWTLRVAGPNVDRTLAFLDTPAGLFDLIASDEGDVRAQRCSGRAAWLRINAILYVQVPDSSAVVASA